MNTKCHHHIAVFIKWWRWYFVEKKHLALRLCLINEAALQSFAPRCTQCIAITKSPSPSQIHHHKFTKTNSLSPIYHHKFTSPSTIQNCNQFKITITNSLLAIHHHHHKITVTTSPSFLLTHLECESFFAILDNISFLIWSNRALYIIYSYLINIIYISCNILYILTLLDIFWFWSC